MRTVAIVLVAVIGLGALASRATPQHEAAATLAGAHHAGALQRELAAAVAARDWCQALHYTVLLESLGHQARWLFNAAELARAAGDLDGALSYYQALVHGDSDYAKAPLARQAISEVTAQIKAQGPGARCPASVPRCGDGAVEGEEACDDGNTASGARCSADCSRVPRCGDGVLDLDEMCDDGNSQAGDNCSPACLPEEAGTPAPVIEAAPPSSPAPDVVIHTPLRPPAQDPEQEAADGRAPAGGDALRSGKLLALATIGGGVVTAVAGLAAAVVGPIPLLSYTFERAVLDGATDDAVHARTAEQYARAVGATSLIEANSRSAAGQWNDSGRVITSLGVGLGLLGGAGIVAGAVLNGRADPSEDEPGSAEVVP